MTLYGYTIEFRLKNVEEPFYSRWRNEGNHKIYASKESAQQAIDSMVEITPDEHNYYEYRMLPLYLNLDKIDSSINYRVYNKDLGR